MTPEWARQLIGRIRALDIGEQAKSIGDANLYLHAWLMACEASQIAELERMSTKELD